MSMCIYCSEILTEEEQRADEQMQIDNRRIFKSQSVEGGLDMPPPKVNKIRNYRN